MEPEWEPTPLPPVVKQDLHRPGPGWTILVLVLAFWIVSQLIDYLGRDEAAKRDMVVRNCESSAELAFRMDETTRRLSVGAPANSKPAYKADAEKLDAIRQEDGSAALLYVTLQDLSSSKILPSDLDLLQKKKVEGAKSLERIYSTEKLTEPEARALVAKLPEGFAYKIAATTALRKAGVKDPAREVFSQTEVVGPFGVGIVIVVAAGIGMLLWLIYAGLRLQGQFKPAGHPAGELSAADADRFAGKVGILLMIPFVMPFALGMISPGLPKPAVALIGYSLMIVATLWMAKLPMFGKRFPLRTLGWRKDRIGKDALWGICAACANVPILVVVAIISKFAFQGLPDPEHPATVSIGNHPSIWILVTTFFAATIAAPIMEETIFRGFLVPAISRITGGPVGGWIVAGLAFAAVHPTGIPAWLPLATIGAMAAAVNYQTGSLVSSVFMHAVHNAATLLITIVVLG